MKYFEQQLADRKIRPTLFLPLWDLLGTALGFGTAVLGKKAAMLCTASVEEVIDKHYLEQIDYLSKNEKKEKDLLAKVKKFRQDELDHRDIAYEEGASKEEIMKLLNYQNRIQSSDRNIKKNLNLKAPNQHPNRDNLTNFDVKN